MDFSDTFSEKHAWTFTALALGTFLTLGGYLYIYSEYAIRHAFRKYTAVDDLSVLGRERGGAKLKGTVVIAGGSMAGLYTALACVPQFEDVVIIEPDDGATEECPVETREGPHGLKVYTCPRKRVMQTFGFHGYQPFMLLALKRWFPDFESHVLASGGTIKPYDAGLCLSGLVYGDPTYIQPEARCLPKHPNIPRDGKVPHSFYLSRVRFEPLLRRLVKKRYPNIRFVRGRVTGIVLDTSKKRVTEVEYTTDIGKKMNLGCALFVDCAGVARMGVRWLQKAGLLPPKVITYDAQLRYGGFYLPIPPSVKDILPIPGGVKNCFPVFYANIPQSLYDWRAIWGMKIEDDIMVIGFGGWGVPIEGIPRTQEEVKAYMKDINQAPGLSVPGWYHEFIDLMFEHDNWNNVVFDEFVPPKNALVEYHKYKSLPDNFLAIGDSASVTSPTYGWGVTKAGVMATTLAGMLDALKGTEIPRDFAKKFFTSSESRTSWTWEATRLMDYGYATTTPCEGETLDKFKFEQAFTRRLLKVCSMDPEAGSRMFYARMWLWPPSIGVSKWTLLKTLWYWVTVE